jgi:hypothetical protein
VADRRDELAPVVQRAIERLRELPAVREGTVARIVAAAARSRAQDAAPNEDDLFPADVGRHPPRRLTGAVAIAAAVVISIVAAELVRTTRHERTVGEPRVGSAAIVTAATASPSALDALPIPTQFVFDGAARKVSLVGDFNNWDENATPLLREPGSTLWSVTVPILRGRHIYAFLVDSVWTVDKRAPVARDPDFGVTGSVILVGRP